MHAKWHANPRGKFSLQSILDRRLSFGAHFGIERVYACVKFAMIKHFFFMTWRLLHKEPSLALLLSNSDHIQFNYRDVSYI